MAEERTVSVFTKINSSNRGRQTAETVVSTTRVLQQEQRKKNRNPKPVLTIFQDLPGLMASTDRPCPTPEPEESDSESEQGRDHRFNNDASNEGKALPAIPSNNLDEDDNLYTEEAEVWELEAGLDEDIEPAEPGNREHFEVPTVDGVDLNHPLLLDLLGDRPVDGATMPPSRVSPVAVTETTSQNHSNVYATGFDF
ncbi:hypothetical protein BDV93DRAFT_564998 [Ceratobasidium sp. AG-I]|nr:hypothetical protein BDV93DRAFT_564998 [Ceratobasidium sp. AG-I]